MISNIDNLGARVEPRIASYLIKEGIPFLMEVVIGTEAERKGGHMARRRSDGQLVLRETAQIAPEDEQSFRDYRHWRYYNTNNLWVDLRALSEVLEQRRRGDGAAADRQPQDRRPARAVLDPRAPARERDGRRDLRASPGRGCCAFPATGSYR